MQNISEADYLSKISYKGLNDRLDLSTNKFSDDERNNYKIRLEKELKIRFNTREFSELNSFKAIFLNVKKKSKS